MADVTTPAGVLAEILALDRLAREGRIDDRALQVGLEALETIGRGRARRHRRVRPTR